MKKLSIVFHTVFLAFAILSLTTITSTQTGGGFDITGAVVATGGGPAANGMFDVELTIGQPVEPGASFGGNFSLASGFWTYTPLAPTAATISISGRVLNSLGAGVTNAVVYLQTQDGELLTTRTSSFGHYRFTDILPGQAVLISVQSKRYSFAPRTVFAVDEITGFDFVPEAEVADRPSAAIVYYDGDRL